MAAVQDFDDELLAIHRDWVAKWAIARPAPLVEGEDEPVVLLASTAVVSGANRCRPSPPGHPMA
jgi:hypothetical protein